MVLEYSIVFRLQPRSHLSCLPSRRVVVKETGVIRHNGNIEAQRRLQIEKEVMQDLGETIATR